MHGISAFLIFIRIGILGEPAENLVFEVPTSDLEDCLVKSADLNKGFISQQIDMYTRCELMKVSK